MRNIDVVGLHPAVERDAVELADELGMLLDERGLFGRAERLPLRAHLGSRGVVAPQRLRIDCLTVRARHQLRRIAHIVVLDVFERAGEGPINRFGGVDNFRNRAFEFCLRALAGHIRRLLFERRRRIQLARDLEFKLGAHEYFLPEQYGSIIGEHQIVRLRVVIASFHPLDDGANSGGCRLRGGLKVGEERFEVVGFVTQCGDLRACRIGREPR